MKRLITYLKTHQKIIFLPLLGAALFLFDFSMAAQNSPTSCPLASCGRKMLMCALWCLVASGFLCLTWNKVIAFLAKVKKIKYWQALLVVITLCVFCAPKYFAKGYRNAHDCGGMDCAKGSCPHWKKSLQEKAETAPAPAPAQKE